MHIKLEYSPYYFDRTCSLWFYCKDGASDFDADIRKNNALKSFE